MTSDPSKETPGPAAQPPENVTPESPRSWWLILPLAILAVLHLVLVFHVQVNWDEFRFLSVVYEYRRGALTEALQTGYVHLFGWLPQLRGQEVDQIIAARTVYWVLLAGSAGSTYLLAREFVDSSAAIFSVLCLFSYSEIIGYGTSFRVDGLALFLLMAGVALVLRYPNSLGAAAGSGTLVAAAFMTTIKSIFYLPTLLVVVAGGRERPGPVRLRRLLTFVGFGTLGFAVLYSVHGLSIPESTLATSVGYAYQAGAKVLLRDLFPQGRYLLVTLLTNPFIWILLLLGTVMIVRDPAVGRSRRSGFLALWLLVPLSSLVFYRNAFPYFYVFVMPPAFVLCAIPFQRVLGKARRGAGAAATAMVLAVLVGFGVHFHWFYQDRLDDQRRVVAAVHQVFPDPVPYIGAHGVISSFPRVGFFMSTWGLESYWEGGTGTFREIVIDNQPKFLLASVPGLDLDAAPYQEVPGLTLKEQDFRTLRNNFVRHWGPIYVPGKRFVAGDSTANWEALVPGVYTVEAETSVLIDGILKAPGDTVYVAPSPAQVTIGQDVGVVTLRWGDHLFRPAETLAGRGFYHRAFYPCGSPFSSCRK